MSTYEEHRSSPKVVLAQAPLTFDPGRAAGLADPAFPRPPHDRCHPTSKDARLSELCRAVRPRAQPIRPHARRPSLARSSSDVARSRPALPVPEPGLLRRTFVERLGETARPAARRTSRLGDLQRHLGLVVGGEAGARLAARLAIPISPDTLLRMARRGDPSPGPRPPPRVLGVDDWAWRRG